MRLIYFNCTENTFIIPILNEMKNPFDSSYNGEFTG
jgi:hypothetical protein